MLDQIIHLSLNNRFLIVVFSLLLVVVGIHMATTIPLDVLPDLTAPTVTIMTDAHGMAPEEVEALVTRPIESAVGGATGVRRVRSNSTFGLSTVWIEFVDSTDIYRARQVVNEKLQLVSANLPKDAVPMMGPVSSIMGEIMTIGLYSDRHAPMELKSVADFTLRKRLLAIPGVSQVVTVGGETKQYRISIDPKKLAGYSLSLHEVVEAARKMNENFSAGVMKTAGEDYLIRGLGRIKSIDDIENSVVAAREGIPVLMRDIASITISPAFRIGDTAVNSRPSVALSVIKHNEVNTLQLTARIDASMADLQNSLPEGMIIDTKIFRQATFINLALENVKKVLIEGAVLVMLILMFFLGNFRTTVISLTAIPLSLVFLTFVFKLLDLNLNTMTLGGIAIAIGVVVDDAIIDVENVFRRLHENSRKPAAERQHALTVIFQATREIRSSIINATLIIIVVFVPLFFLSGMEGRLLRPLGISYIVSIGASLFVALTVTPALCAIMLSGYFGKAHAHEESEADSLLVRFLKAVYRPVLSFSTRFPVAVLLAGVLLTCATYIPFSKLGRSFLPSFNEGSLTARVATAPGTSLEKASEAAEFVAQILQKHPNVVKTSRKTGRGEGDEHGKFSNESEIEAVLDLKDRTLHQVLTDFRVLTAKAPGVRITFSQPLTHRIDHMLSGTMANLAVKVFGPELFRLRGISEAIYEQMKDIPGVVDLAVEQQKDVSQVRIVPRRQELAKYGLPVADLGEAVEIAMEGLTVSTTLEGEKEFEIVVKLPDEIRKDLDSIKALLIDTPLGVKIPLGSLADITSAKGPYMVNRENAQRKMVVQANVGGRDLRGVYEDVRTRISQNVPLPEGYYIEYGGQFESEAEATRMISLLSIFSMFFIFLFLYMEFGSYRESVMVMINLPLALIGGIVAIYMTTGIIDVSSLVGFITLFGIATRNGILLISHYHHLMTVEKKTLHEAVFQGSLERLRPVLMTALAAGLALVPFAMAADKPGNEILSPLAIVILGGLLSSTGLNMILLPALYVKFGKKKHS